MPLPDGWTGLVHGVPAWFSRLLGASQAQVPAGTEVYAQNVDVIDRDGRLLGQINVTASGGATADNQVIMITSLQQIDDLQNALVSVGLDALLVQQLVHDLLNCNANIQVGDVDVSNANPVPVSDAGGSLTVDQPAHDNLNANANIQVGDVDVGPANLVPVDVANNVETTFDHGSNSAIGVAATQFIVAATPAVLGVEVKAANDNTANIYIGNADVTAATVDATDGMELGPGESILVRIDDVNKLYAIAAADTQRVFWLRV